MKQTTEEAATLAGLWRRVAEIKSAAARTVVA